jgi:hypothetical protein
MTFVALKTTPSPTSQLLISPPIETSIGHASKDILFHQTTERLNQECGYKVIVFIKRVLTVITGSADNATSRDALRRTPSKRPFMSQTGAPVELYNT